MFWANRLRKIPKANYLSADEIERLVKNRESDVAKIPEGPNSECTQRPSGCLVHGTQSDAALNAECRMEDSKSAHEKLLVVAADCDLIARLATDPKKRDTFAKLAKHLKQLADDVATEIARRERDSAD